MDKHRHLCECGFCYEHNPDSPHFNPDRAHFCPLCGQLGTYKYFGTVPVMAHYYGQRPRAATLEKWRRNLQQWQNAKAVTQK